MAYSVATSSAVIDSLQGNNRAAFEQLWLVMVRIVSFPWLGGNLVIKSMVIIPNGKSVYSGGIGCMGILDWLVLGLVLWHVPHPFT